VIQLLTNHNTQRGQNTNTKQTNIPVCACVCIGLYAILVFPRFLCVVICVVAVSLTATCVLLASRVYVCVCAQVSCSVVSNWSLCDLFVDVCILIYLSFNLLSIIFNFFQFCLFLRHQTMDKVQKHNSFNANTPSSKSYKKEDCYIVLLTFR
jgi:hypothetical protein